MYPGGDMIWMALGWTIALGVLVAAFWSVLTLFNGLCRLSEANESPEEILKRRLAAGEIDLDEYGRRLAALSKTRHAA